MRLRILVPILTLVVISSSCSGLSSVSGGSTAVESASELSDAAAPTESTNASPPGVGGVPTTAMEASETEDSLPTPATLGPAELAELEQAKRSSVEVSGPYAYVTLAPICEGCGDQVGAQLYLVPSVEDPLARSLGSLWVDGQSSEPRAEDLWVIDPALVPDRLIQAVEAGAEVIWEIDPITLMVRSWSIDGVGASYSCYQIDTASVEMRDKDCYGGLLGRG